MDWKTRLAEFLTSKQWEPLKWGKHDCCLFVCDCLKEITGDDPGHWFRGKYRSESGAYKLLTKYSKLKRKDNALLRTVEMICKEFGYEKIEIPLRQNGDVCIVKTEAGLSLAICFNGQAVVTAPESLLYLPEEFIVHAWHVHTKKD
jgi:hypothetical protein